MSSQQIAPEKSQETPAAEGHVSASRKESAIGGEAKAESHAQDVSRRDDEARFLNREVSWLRFNSRVLEEALDPRNPLLERVKFLSIYASNLDEFFMIRVSGLRSQMAAGVLEAPPDGMTPAEQLRAIREYVIAEQRDASKLWDELRPQLEDAGVAVLDYEDLQESQREALRRHFEAEIFPVLTPLAFDPGHPFPHISNLSLNLAVVVKDPEQGERFARIKVPQTIPRLVPVSTDGSADTNGLDGFPHTFVFLEQLVSENLDLLFPGLEIIASHPFRVTRDADFEIEEDEAADLLTAMAEVVGQRHFGSVVRLEVDRRMPEEMRRILTRNLGIKQYQVYTSEGMVGFSSLMQIAGLDLPEHRDPPFLPSVPRSIAEDGYFETISRRDILLYHPYDSFEPVVDFIREAARDPNVLAIKQTLYRVGPNSPVVEALMEARENGKQVSVLVELKARFDEENNIVWAKALEKSGVHVTYGLVGLKTHAKMCLVVRRESSGIRTYVHLSTGNYNPSTAKLYTDIGFITSDPIIGRDVTSLFNSLTGYSLQRDYQKLLVAPGTMRQRFIERIDREAALHQQHGDGFMAFKLNSLVDPDCIEALYRASQVGVKIALQVRGICCLRPGVPGLSENIEVNSLVGRFLEHPRIYYFRNGGDEEVLMGSADLMPRNLDGRVELLFPIEDRALRSAVIEQILFRHLRDTSNVRTLRPDGTYSPKRAPGADRLIDSHADLLGSSELPWRS